ncbi:Uncharacterized protein Rs2_25592 [Raphanus sativus]|nr:Uncharacterized protein Rs2_25592 [Raphanus sativus]
MIVIKTVDPEEDNNYWKSHPVCLLAVIILKGTSPGGLIEACFPSCRGKQDSCLNQVHGVWFEMRLRQEPSPGFTAGDGEKSKAGKKRAKAPWAKLLSQYSQDIEYGFMSGDKDNFNLADLTACKTSSPSDYTLLLFLALPLMRETCLNPDFLFSRGYLLFLLSSAIVFVALKDKIELAL